MSYFPQNSVILAKKRHFQSYDSSDRPLMAEALSKKEHIFHIHSYFLWNATVLLQKKLAFHLQRWLSALASFSFMILLPFPLFGTFFQTFSGCSSQSDFSICSNTFLFLFFLEPLSSSNSGILLFCQTSFC